MNLIKISVITIIFLTLPMFAFAAYNDVSLTTDANLTVNSLTFSVSGSTAEIQSITVNSTDFTVTILADSEFTITSTDRAKFFVETPTLIQITRTCTSSVSTLKLSNAPTQVTVTVSITSDACDATPSDSSSSSSGGGGTASSPGVVTTSSAQTTVTPTVETTTVVAEETTTVAQAETTTTETTTTIAVTATSISSTFTKVAKKGASNSEIKRLQQLLNSDPDTAVATSGVGSVGNETNYFGSLTEKAIQKFQMKHGVVSSSSDAGYGLVGPKTRAKLAEVFGDTTTTPASSVAQPSEVAISVSPVFTKGLSRGSSNADIKRLQQLLNSDPDTAVATSGVGSVGNETDFYGSLTEKAVQKFQMKHGVVSDSSDAGYGYVGPKTRAKLSEIFGE